MVPASQNCDLGRLWKFYNKSWSENLSGTSSVLSHCTALHFTALQRTALHCTALHLTALQRTALHCTALHLTALQSIALYYTALHGTKIH